MGDDNDEFNEDILGDTDDKFVHKLDKHFLRDFNKEYKHDQISNEEDHSFYDETSENMNNDAPILEPVNYDDNEKSSCSETAIDLVTKPGPIQIDPIKSTEFTEASDNKFDIPQATASFSPQNMTAKLLSSLKMKSDNGSNTNDMLIYDDTHKNLETDQVENLIDEAQIPSILEHNEKILDDQEISRLDEGEQIVDILLCQLLNEIKESMVPARENNQSEYWQARDLSYNNTIMRKLAFEGSKGIPTDFKVIDSYLKEVIDEIIRNESAFINNILSPIQRDPMEMLHLLRTSDIGSYSHFDTYDFIIPILGVEIYLEIEKRKEQERQDINENSENSQSNSESLIGECEHIHNKNIFDCINESLNQFRPYGKEGVPMPWSTKLRKLREDEILEFSKMFEIIKQDLFRWSFTSAGTLPKREFINEHDNFEEEYFGEVREKRLAALLASDVMENEYKWTNYDFEESQVKIDVSDMIMEHVITETINILKVLGKPYRDSSIYTDQNKIDSVFKILPLQDRLEAEGISIPSQFYPEFMKTSSPSPVKYNSQN